MTASVTTQATAIADLQTGAEAGYMIRAQAGGAVSRLDLVAADGNGGVPSSMARIVATDILLDRSVAMSQLKVTDLSGDHIGNGDFSAGDLSGWTSIDYDAASVVAGAASSAPSAYVLRFVENAGHAGVVIARQAQHCAAGERFSVGYHYQAALDASGQVEPQSEWSDASGAWISTAGM